MKFKFYFFAFLVSQNFLSAQVVYTLPEFPTQNDSIIVYLDATQPGAEELLNYTGVVYAHTGVHTNLGTWQHVIGDWANNTNQPALTRLSTNLYQLTVGHPRQFYNVTNGSEHILQLALVFRSANAALQTRPDIFIDLYEPGLTVVINNPNISTQFGDPLRSPAFASQNDTIDIEITAAEIGTEVSIFTLYVNNVQVASTTNNNIIYDFVASQHSDGANELLAVAVDTSGAADSTEFVIFVNPPVEDAALPEGKRHGINYDNTTSVTLALFAPFKEFVYVLGDFNDWKVSTDYYMKREEIAYNKVIWWITIDNLVPGQEYAFQYYVDGEIRIADPYTEKVLDQSNDPFISNTTYPNLKPYPFGKTVEIVSVLQTDQTPYPWQITNFEKPAKTDLVIYELLLRDFLTEHDYKTLEDTISYLKTLGVNAIELMPIMEFEGNISWGYNPSFHLAVDKYYGPKNDLKRFIDKAHENGIAVILDMVLNHVFGQSPLARLYWDPANNRPHGNNPWLNPVPRHPFNVGSDFNHESLATKDYVDRVTEFWVTEYKFDGYRFDLSKGFTQTNSGSNVSLWGQYDQSRINILKRMADKIWEVDSTTLVILEHFADNSEETVLSDYGMMLWGNMNHEYNEATMGYASNLSGTSYKSRGWNDPHLISYMESHDEERLMYKNLQFGNSSGTYNIKNLRTALERIKLAAAFYFLIPGPRQIWQFGELGYDYSINYPCNTSECRLDPKPIRWDYKNDGRRINVYKAFSHLINLKKNYEAFKSTDFSMSVSSFGKRININHTSMDVTLIGNFNVTALDVNPNFQSSGWWYDYFTGDSINVSNPTANINLQPGEFRIYTTVKLPTPEPNIINDVERNEDVLITDYFLEQNYPNPFNPTTSIEFRIVNSGFVSLKVYDILGREIKSLVNEDLGNGIYHVDWNGDNEFGEKVGSGIYFYRIETEDYKDSRKMILVK
ncbi:MAG TPA: alpha-amylase family glycosyl hydrolase [Ignavibacteriaceae bacterium]|nr:alpha-amylase family glycosyl hydrolase [Ignavibacteriaceae bacterium]